MNLLQALAPHVEPAIQQRGATYYAQKLVRIDDLQPQSVEARVFGSETYAVTLLLEDDSFHASCSCPYVLDHDDICKHIWATVLAANARGFGLKVADRLFVETFPPDDFEDDDVDVPYPFHEPRTTPVRKALPTPKSKPPVTPKPASWQVQLAEVRRHLDNQPVRRHTERRFLYLVNLPASQQAKKVILALQTQERLKKGDWSKPKVLSAYQVRIEEFPDAIDQRLYALFNGCRLGAYQNYGQLHYELDGPLLEAVLALLAASGRVFLSLDPHARSPLAELVADIDPPWEIAMAVDREASSTNWLLSAHLRRGEETMTLTDAQLLVPGFLIWNGRFGRVDAGESMAWVAALRKAGEIRVPANMADVWLKALLEMPRLPRLQLPEELAYTEASVAPRTRLVVKPAPYGQGGYLLGELSFDYDGAIVPSTSPDRGVFQPETRRFLLRDPEIERAAVQRMVSVSNFYDAIRRAKFEFRATILPKLVRELTAEGWLIEAEGKLYRQAGAFEMAVSSGQDWFDLSAKVDFDGIPVTLPRLLAALRKGENTVVLDDGSLGLVPEEWLKQYGLIARLGTVEGDQLRFAKAQVGVLDALLASRPEVTFDKQFAKARDELRKFTGITAADPPASFKGELRQYQREGLGWLRFLRKFGFGGCLADDMGLGKTVQVLALLAGKRNGPTLVVVPRSLIFNWMQEAKRFAPKLKVLDHTGTARMKTSEHFKDYDLVLTTYGTLRKDAALLAETRFDTCVLDESQAAKNATTETAKAVRLVNADHRLAMSGTPVENHLGELWTLFDFLNPGMLGRTALTGNNVRQADAESRDFLAKALRPFILRRTKDQVAKDLPAKTEQTVYCDLEADQRKLYDELRDHYRRMLLAKVDAVGLGRSKIQVLEALLRLRQAACHPGLIDKKRTAESSAKLDVLLPQLLELAEGGRKALVFSQFTSFLSIVRQRLDQEGVAYEYLDGKTLDRAARVERFQTDPTCRLFLVSLKAGGVGLNLTAAEYVFLLDPWWNPAVEAQAIDRSHRIGQTKSVFAYRLIARDTVEEKVLALQQSKRELADAILGGDGRVLADLRREDLEMLLS